MQNPVTLPGQDVYLNHLTPEAATQFEFARNFYLTVLGAAIWDVFVYIPTDVRIISKGIRFVTICFIFSRVFAITYGLLFMITQTPGIGCGALSIATEICCILSMTFASFLFLPRLYAVYAENRIVRWTYTLLWLGVTTCGISTFVGVHMTRIPGTYYCILYKIDSYVSVINFLPAAFDSLVFFTISYKLIAPHGIVGGNQNWRSIITGKTLPHLSRVLLQSGQQYYLVVFGTTVISGLILYLPSIPPAHKELMTLITATLAASMGCRVFRNLKTLEMTPDPALLPIISPLAFAQQSQSKDEGNRAARTTIPGVPTPSSLPALSEESEKSSLNSDSRSELGTNQRAIRHQASSSSIVFAQLANEAMAMGSPGIFFCR